QQQVPASAPAGIYSFAANLSDLNFTYIETDYLNFIKAEGAVTDANDSWSGQSFPIIASGNDFEAPINLPTDYSVGSAFPNPFNAMTTFSIHLPQTSDLKVEVYDVTGRLAATVMDGSLTAGTHDVSINAESFASGMYFLRATVQGQLDHTQKIMLVK
ncbi:MAG TPA: T9SS type A sorting domain-containing protein, partial [Bacteroidetes bacterium]|nr:T9SS type A sorting domain-containing protein [Bacteroidota bacterium]HEX05116.1 T9SS type A sorting domain-containing protein [Bacteroidota bacterium]